MKKLKLNLRRFEGAEVLTRNQLKNVLGGSGNATTTSLCDFGHLSCSANQECWQINKGDCNGKCCTL